MGQSVLPHTAHAVGLAVLGRAGRPIWLIELIGGDEEYHRPDGPEYPGDHELLSGLGDRALCFGHMAALLCVFWSIYMPAPGDG